MIIDEIFKQIDAGRSGENHGYSMGLPKLEGIIDGVTKETYTLILSNSGAGKSSFALYAYVYKPLMEHLDDDNYKVLFFALEMSEWSLYIKLLSIYIFEKYGIQLSFKEILSKKKEYILSDEHYELVFYQISAGDSGLNELIKNVDKSFAKALTDYIDAKGLSDPEVYRRAHMDKRTFHKIKNPPINII